MDENDISYLIRGAIFDVYNGLGPLVYSKLLMKIPWYICLENED